MFLRKKKEKDFFSEFTLELKRIWADVLFVYKNFIGWTLSKIVIYLWTLVLGLIVMVPFAILISIFGLFDPIKWLSIFSTSVASQDLLLQALANNPVWFVFMLFLFLVMVLAFLIATTYYLFLLAKLYSNYVKGKLLHPKKNLYYSRPHILTFFALVSWTFVYTLAPAIIFAGVIFYAFGPYNIMPLSTSSGAVILFISLFVFIASELYILYRVIFAFVIMAFEKKDDPKLGARAYIKKSIELTTGKSIFKFAFLVVIYGVVLSPLNFTQDTLSIEIDNMQDAIAFKSQAVENIDSGDVKYYEYITKKYDDDSQEDLVDRSVLYSRIIFLLVFIRYFLFSGIFVLLLSSFYYHVLLRKK